AAIVRQNQRRFHKPLLTTRYQAVTLTNGHVFYGRIDHLGTDHPVLRDAFELRTEPDPKSGRATHAVVWRKSGPTGADHLILPAASIGFVEPVRSDSPIGQAIEQATRDGEPR
ncbi:MAG: hypothetical protein GX644_08450, partial [Limnobacter sp.]|nr:hypothetical protein [Limnobacter sp.]